MDNKPYNVVAYINNSRNNKQYPHKVGVAFIGVDSKIRIHLNTIPTHGWDGWLNVFEASEKDQETAKYGEEEFERERKTAVKKIEKRKHDNNINDRDVPF